MKKIIFILAVTLFSGHMAFTAGAEGVGGALLFTLEGFENAADQGIVRKAIGDSVNLLEQLNLDVVKEVPELSKLKNEIKYSKYILMPHDVAIEPNKNPGDYNLGGFLVASTDFMPGAPTRIYPRWINRTQLSTTQWVQVVIHEALHRALPSPMNQDEQTTERLTSIITQYNPNEVAQALKEYFNYARTKKVPWMVLFERHSVDHYATGGTITSEIERHTDEILGPLIEEGTLRISTSENTRIKIILKENSRGELYSVVIIDQYLREKYSYTAAHKFGDIVSMKRLKISSN